MSRLIKIKSQRAQRQTRIRRRVRGTSDRPRLTVFISLKHIYVQVIDDSKGQTLVAVSSLKLKPQTLSSQAEIVGKKLGDVCKTKKIKKVVLDRGSKKYHGRLKILSESARKQGLEF